MLLLYEGKIANNVNNFVEYNFSSIVIVVVSHSSHHVKPQLAKNHASRGKPAAIDVLLVSVCWSSSSMICSVRLMPNNVHL